MKNIVLRYTNANSVNNNACIDMELGRQNNVVGYGKSWKRKSQIKRGSFVFVIPELQTLKHTKRADVFVVTGNTTTNVWKVKDWESKQAAYIRSIWLSQELISKIGKCGQTISSEVANEMFSIFDKVSN